jgi:hypothetical protein
VSLRIGQSSDQVSRASPPSVAGGFTLTAWVRLRVDRDDFSTIARVSSGGSTVVTWAAQTDGTSGPGYFTGGGEVVNATGLAVDAWRKVAITCAGTAAKAYAQIPGGATEVDSGTVSSGVGDLLALGGRGAGDSSEWLNGTLAHVRVFASELTQAQVEAEWNSPTPVLSAWAAWPLATDLLDVSGNGRHLTAGATSSAFEDDPPLGISGALAGAAPRAIGALAGAVRHLGALAGAAPAAVGALAGAVRNLGQLAGAVPAAFGALAADVRNPGALAGAAPRPTGVLVGSVSNLGQLAAVAPAAVGTLHHTEPSGTTERWSAGAPVLGAGWSVGEPALAGAWSAGSAS